MSSEIYTASEASRLLNVPLGRVLRHLNGSKRKVHRLGRTIVLRESELFGLARELNPAASAEIPLEPVLSPRS
jgi:hypothetical protein